MDRPAQSNLTTMTRLPIPRQIAAGRLIVVFCLLVLGHVLGAAEPGALPQTAQLPVVRLEVVTVTPDNGRLRKQKITGSGVLISPDGLVLTNYHVIRQAVRATAWLADGRKRRARMVGTDAATDLAVLQLAAESADERFPTAAFADGDTLKAGARVWAVGSPGNLSQAITAGVVANPALTLPDERTLPLIDGERVGRLVRWIAHDASIFPGNSGGPLMNAAGEIVGINEISVAGLGGAIPAGLARRVAAELTAHGRVARAWLGVEWQPAPEGAAGVRVGTVWPGGPAEKAGVRPGDRVVRLGSRPVAAATADALVGVAQAEEACAPASPVDLVLERGGETVTVLVAPELRPPARMPLREVPGLGVVVRDITPPFAWENGLTGTDGVWVESVRPGGKFGQARPALRAGDRITSWAGRPVQNVDDLRAEAAKPEGEVLVGFERERGDWVTLLTPAVTGSAAGSSRRGWLGLEVQAMERPLAEKLGVPGGAALRVTEVLQGTSAERAGFRPGDAILAIDGERPEVRRIEDASVLAAILRSRRPGTEVSVTVWRDGGEAKLAAALDARPAPAAEMERLEWPEIELTVRAATEEDRRMAGLAPDTAVVAIAQVESAGWAELAGLAAGDILLAIDGRSARTVADVAEIRSALLAQPASGKVTITAQRGRHRTVLAEIEAETLP